MKTVRRSVFETNSSSTHAISIPKGELEVNSSVFDWEPVDNYYWGKDGNSIFTLPNGKRTLLLYTFCRQEFTLYKGLAAKLIFVGLGCDSILEVKELIEKAIEILKREAKEYYQTIEKKEDYEKYPRYYNDTKETIKTFFSETVYELRNIIDVIDEYPIEADRQTLRDLKNRLLNDDELLTKYLLDERSYLSLGGDEYYGYYIKNIGFSYHSDNFEERLEKERESNHIYLF